MEYNALNKIRQVRQKYILYYLLADGLLAAAIAVAGCVILSLFFARFLLFFIILFVLIFSLLMARHRQWLIRDKIVTAFLDSVYPELEESSSIVLMQKADLNLLQQLQLEKVVAALVHIPSNHEYFIKPVRRSATLLICALILSFLASEVNYHWGTGKATNSVNNIQKKSNVKEVILPQVESVDVVIRPPAYTNLQEYRQSKFSLETEEDAVIDWKLTTNVAVKKVSLLFNERDNLPLKSQNDDGTKWEAKKTLTKPGFYQVVIDGKSSDLYQVQVINDLPPVIQIKTPKQYTYIDAGEKPQVILDATVTDDYGVSGTEIYATIAKGSGEAVKFKEQKIEFPISFSQNERKYNLQKTIDLQALNVEPGDELYFYVQARDNNAQLSRTDVYIVSVQDTAQLLSMDGILSGTDIKPEYFRSERQIILDAETLLKEKDTLRQDKFKDRSNELGTDQKLLRLRYGKFLGEEAEGNIEDPRVAGNDKAVDPKDFGNGAKILDEYTDKHDNAEDAQFFDPKVKEQLKATLTEMWKAELQLRLYQPAEALPFAYKALRLLKDLQQKSRSFVAKTAYNPSPLKMEKRLSGDLDKIIQPTEHRELKIVEDRFSSLKKSVGILEQLSYTNNISGADRRLLQEANQQLGEKAALQPGAYLGAASAMRRIIAGNKKGLSANIAIVETAIRKILPASEVLPQSSSTTADMGLSQSYFLNFNH